MNASHYDNTYFWSFGRNAACPLLLCRTVACEKHMVTTLLIFSAEYWFRRSVWVAETAWWLAATNALHLLLCMHLSLHPSRDRNLHVARPDSLSKTILQGTLDGGRCRGRRHSNPETCLLYIPTTKKSVIRVVTFLAVFQNNDSCFTDSLPYSYRQNKTMCKCSAYCLFQATNRQSDSLQCTKMLLLCVWSITRI